LGINRLEMAVYWSRVGVAMLLLVCAGAGEECGADVAWMKTHLRTPERLDTATEDLITRLVDQRLEMIRAETQVALDRLQRDLVTAINTHGNCCGDCAPSIFEACWWEFQLPIITLLMIFQLIMIFQLFSV